MPQINNKVHNKFLNLPVAAFGLLLGICATLLITNMPALSWIVLIAALAIIAIFSSKTNTFRFCCFTVLGFSFMLYQVQQQLARPLPANIEAQHKLLSGSIISLIEYAADGKAKFRFKLDDYLINVQLTWAQAPADLKPGDQWLLPLKLKRPRNYANLGSFDSEKDHFQKRNVATGYVTKKARPQLLQRSYWSAPVNNTRQEILRVINANLTDCKFIGVLIALILGTKSQIPFEQWQVFQNTGIAHLMSISGLHMGLIASLCFVTLKFFWKFVPRSCLQVSAPWIAAAGALLCSVIYGLLAGFSIATQRSLIMIVVFLSGIILRHKVSSVQSYSLALLLVLLADPLAVLSIGFWLSFFAVGLLLYALRGTKHKSWLWPQLIMGLGLLPISLLFFAQSPLIAPLVNMIAIPWVSFAVVPLAVSAVPLLLVSESLALKLLTLADYNFSLLWPGLEKCNQIPIYVWQQPEHHWAMLCALIAVLWLFAAKGLPGRYWSVIGFLPLFWARSSFIPHGQAQFTLLDVGQGLSAVVRTQQHVLVYDTGAKLNANFDLGSKVVVPYLQATGIKAIDQLMISHADNDHIGGAESIIAKIKTKEILINDISKLHHHDPKLCVSGKSWSWDGVWFEILHPNYEKIGKKTNDHSCVLMINAGQHKILLTGDIEAKAEKLLVATYGKKLQADLLLVPHHGSKTSSSLEFIQAVQPKYALIPVGYKNQYGHPKAEILARYAQLKIPVLRSELDGAISFRLGDPQDYQLKPSLYRRQQHKFWLAKDG